MVTFVASNAVVALSYFRPGLLRQEVNRKQVQSIKDFGGVSALTATRDTVLLLAGEGGFLPLRYVLV